MQQYLDIIRTIQRHGKPKIARTYKTTGIFDAQFSFDLSTGKFPILTTRRIFMLSSAAELWCFIHGITSKAIFRQMGCNFWDEWCNPTHVPAHLTGEARSEAVILEDDLGPIYGYQWRAFNEPYLPNQYKRTFGGGSDQLLRVTETLRKNPDDRRMLVSAWAYCQIPQMALPPCHVLFNLVHYDGTLHLKWHQRSCDMVLGVPYNITCYALLLILLAKHANLRPGVVSGTLCDAHIYDGPGTDGSAIDHRPGLEIQLARPPLELPTWEMWEVNPDSKFDIFQWKPNHFKLLNYNHAPSIKFDVAV